MALFEKEVLGCFFRAWVFEAIEEVKENLPFELLGIDSDNGSEFINNHLFRYCIAEEITFTRGRSYKKNDGCYVEQKNWSVVRRNVGYRRYDTEEELATLNQLYGYLGLYANFFSTFLNEATNLPFEYFFT